MSINVAAALAEDGAHVLLVDADLRHPSVAHHLGLEGSAGLAHVLSGQMSPKDVVQNYWKPNLHILPAGKTPSECWRTSWIRHHAYYGRTGFDSV